MFYTINSTLCKILPLNFYSSPSTRQENLFTVFNYLQVQIFVFSVNVKQMKNHSIDCKQRSDVHQHMLWVQYLMVFKTINIICLTLFKYTIMMNRFVRHYDQNHIILIWELLNQYYYVWIWEYIVLNGCQWINDCNIKLARTMAANIIMQEQLVDQQMQ